MPLRNQPYLPLYVQDFLTDEKLIYCSAAATGVYIRLMCILHKQEPYGKLLLRQNHKQTIEQTIKQTGSKVSGDGKNNLYYFALQLSQQMPYEVQEIKTGLGELIGEGVIKMTAWEIWQPRMVRDSELSDKRAQSGAKGGKKFASNFARAKTRANTENEIVNENENNKIGGAGGKMKKPTPEELTGYLHSYTGEKLELCKTMAAEYLNHYDSNGWKVGRNSMKDWKAAARNWHKRQKEYGPKNDEDRIGRYTRDELRDATDYTGIIHPE